MDLNVSPPEEDEDYFVQHVEEDENYFKQHAEEDKPPPKYVEPPDYTESAVQIARREREERRQRLKRERIDDRPRHTPQQVNRDHAQQNTFRSYDKSKLPPGWLDCPPMGHEIHGLIPSKVPLGENFNDCIPPGQRYSFKQAFIKARLAKKRIGLVIDLTNTSRYYNVSDWKRDGIKHVKIQCRGRDSVPDNESVNRFVYEVSRFLSRMKHEKHVFVHCTHGHNRTGFMIVHYLVRVLSYSVTQAVKEFADARPPGIYKPDYIEALYTFYHENRPEMAVCPQTPEWKRSSDLDLNGDAVPDDDDEDGDSTAPVQENHEINTVMTNDDILGDSIPYDQQNAMRHFCYQALKLPIGPKGNSQFPGSHPVSLDRENLQLLRQRYYYATWKADGTRYMMLITLDGCYLIDRNFNFRRVQMKFPCSRRANEAPFERTHNLTLLDGEMIIDILPDTQKQERRYLIYDLMAIDGRSIIELTFSERWRLLEKEIVEPRKLHQMYQINHPRPDYFHYRYELEPFRIRRKSFWPLSTVYKLLREFIPSLSHEADGLIFQGWDDPYVPRTHEGLLKWKYAHMNSVDFLFEMNDEWQLLYLFERGKKKLMGGDRVQFNDDSDPASYAGKIIECAWNSDENVWVFMRIRPDKTTPNEFNTYKKVLRSIRDNITEEVLMSEINETMELPMYVERLKKLTKPNAPRRQ